MSGEEQWRRWARDQGLEPADEAADAALRVLAAGASVVAAAAAARVAARRHTASDVNGLRQELTWIESVVSDLEVHGTPDVVEHYRRRRDAVARALSLASSTPAAAAPAASAPHAAPPSLREFLSENSILVLSSLGAFLLIVATVLFELYGGTGVPGWLRFGAVLALALAFGGAGWACLRSVALKVVGQTYVAIFALMAPLSGVAAYVFLELGAQGITRDDALATIGISSAVLYAVLALKLESRAYAVLSLVAFPIGLVGTLNVLVVPEWRAVGLSLLVPLYVIAAHTGRRRDPFSQVAEPFVHVAAVVAVLWAVGSAASIDASVRQSGSPDPFSWPTTITLTVTGAGYALYALQARRQQCPPLRIQSDCHKLPTLHCCQLGYSRWGQFSLERTGT